MNAAQGQSTTTEGKSVSLTLSSISKQRVPRLLYGYFSLGSHSLKSHADAPGLNIGIGYTLNHRINNLSLEFESAGNIGKHNSKGILYNPETKSTLLHTHKKEVNTSSLMLNYRFGVFEHIYDKYSLDLHGRTGIVYWEERTYSHPFSDTNALNEVSDFDEEAALRAGVMLIIRTVGNAGIFLSYSIIGTELSRFTIGFRSSGRSL